MYDWNYNVDAYALYDRAANPVFRDPNVKPDVAFPDTMTFPDWRWLWYTTVDGLITCWAMKPTRLIPDTPTVSFAAAPTGGSVPLPVTFTANITGGYLPYAYTIDYGDGTTPASGTRPSEGSFDVSHLYSNAGSFTAKLTVADAQGASLTAEETISAGAAPPPPPPPAVRLDILVVAAGAALLLALGGIAIYQQRF